MIARTTDCQLLQDWRANRPYCNFRLSAVVAIAQGQSLRAGRGRKATICRQNCHHVCHSFRYISVSDFGDHIAISGCRSSSQSPGVSFYALGVVENPRYAIGIPVISVILWEMLVLPVLTATLLCPIVCRIYVWTLSLTLAWLKTLFTALGLQ